MNLEIKYQRCLPCPFNSYCLGGSFITPLAGYYRKSFTSTNVVGCTIPEACLGFVENTDFSDPSLIYGSCMIGSYGPLCFYCDIQYGKYQNRDSCSYCQAIQALVYVRLSLSIIFILLEIMISVSHVQNYTEKNRDKDIFSIVSKIIINHSQYVMLIIKNSLSLPDFSVFKEFFNIFDFISFLNIGSFMNECFVQIFFYNPKMLIIYLSLSAALIPLFVALSTFMLWILSIFFLTLRFKSKFYKLKQRNLHKIFFLKYFIYLLLTAYMFYPLIIKCSFTLLDCFKLDLNEDNTYLRESPEIECWSTEHFQYICFYGLPGILIWGISFPFFLFAILRKNRGNIKQIKKQSINPLINKTYKQENSNFSKKNSQISQNIPEKILQQTSKTIDKETTHKVNNNLSIFGYFYCGYRSKYYYWESLIFLRKFLLTLILTLDQKIAEEYKWIMVISILFTSLILILKHQPYKIQFINKLESFSLITCIISSFISALSVSDEESIFKTTANICGILFNLIFYIAAVIFIIYDFSLKSKGALINLKIFLFSNFF